MKTYERGGNEHCDKEQLPALSSFCLQGIKIEDWFVGLRESGKEHENIWKIRKRALWQWTANCPFCLQGIKLIDWYIGLRESDKECEKIWKIRKWALRQGTESLTPLSFSSFHLPGTKGEIPALEPRVTQTARRTGRGEIRERSFDINLSTSGATKPAKSTLHFTSRPSLVRASSAAPRPRSQCSGSRLTAPRPALIACLGDE